MYNRLFTKILDSSIWLEPDSTRIVWITLLASMDQDGYAHFSALENLAARARVSLAKAQRAIEILESDDPNSENPAKNGKRIERVPGGWLVLNAISYRQKFSKEIEREQTRLRVAKHRAKEKDGNGKPVTKTLQSVSPASASVSSSVRTKNRCTKEEAEKYCISIGLPASDGEAMFLHWQEKGWAKVKDWKLTIQKWKSFGYLPSQKQKKPWNEKKSDPIQSRIDREYEEAQKRKVERREKQSTTD